MFKKIYSHNMMCAYETIFDHLDVLSTIGDITQARTIVDGVYNGTINKRTYGILPPFQAILPVITGDYLTAHKNKIDNTRIFYESLLRYVLQKYATPSEINDAYIIRHYHYAKDAGHSDMMDILQSAAPNIVLQDTAPPPPPQWGLLL